MKSNDLIFVGFNRRVAALNRQTGELVWQWKATRGQSYVSLLLDGDLLVVAVDGYMYGLNPSSGEELWFNEMSGFGTGVTSLVSAAGAASNSAVLSAAAKAAAQAASQSSSSSS